MEEDKKIKTVYALIDIGSNTIRLALYCIEDGKIKQMLSKKETVGLIRYVDKAGNLSREGISKLIRVLRTYNATLEALSVNELFSFATASLRNLSNTEEVLDRVKKRTGLCIQILTGYEEALFDYYGLLQEIDVNRGLLMDVGGGSTELVFMKKSMPVAAHSIDIGSLNLYTGFVSSILPTGKEIEKIRLHVADQLSAIVKPPRFPSIDTLYTIGGTARTAQLLYRVMTGTAEEYCEDEEESADIFAPIPAKDFLAVLMKKPERLTEFILKLSPERIHTQIPGLCIIEGVINAYGCEFVKASPYGVREGYLYFLLKQRGVLQ